MHSSLDTRKPVAAQCRRARAAVQQARAAGVSPPNWATAAKIHVGLPGRPGTVAVLPAYSVTHAPPFGREATLCPFYVPSAAVDGAVPERCPRGHKCPFVHCDVPEMAVYTPQVAPDCPDIGAGDPRRAAPPPERFPYTGHSVAVAQPHATEPCAHVPTEALYVTRVFDTIPGGIHGLSNAPTGFAAHECAHFRRRRRCDRGADCAFAHLVYPVCVVPAASPKLDDPTAASGGRCAAPTSRHPHPRDDAGPQLRHPLPPSTHPTPYQHRPYSAKPRTATRASPLW